MEALIATGFVARSAANYLRAQESGSSILRADNSDPRHINAEEVETDQDASLRVNVRLAIEDAMRKWMYLPAAISLVLFPISVQAQGPAQKNSKSESAKVLSAGETTSQPPKQVTEDSNYSIAPEDVLTIDVWKEPEISRTVPVRRDGKISLPLLNDLQAAGLTPTQLSVEIVEKLRATIVHPQVTVIVAQMSGLRIYILGQVTRGGAYPLVPDMTVMQALSIAGGFTPYANVKKIQVMRKENGADKIFAVNYKEVISGRKTEQNLHLKAGDTIVVP
jgi:polysaccharide biosynthesis/export protein